jgi:hypothetical protein
VDIEDEENVVELEEVRGVVEEVDAVESCGMRTAWRSLSQRPASW